MNGIAANALLKTLEEPFGDVRFVLATNAAHQLLATIRSRCLGHALTWPAIAEAQSWLVGCGVNAADASILLQASGGRPADALGWHARGHTGLEWGEFPSAMARGNVAFVKDWSPQELVDSLHKLCHDLLAKQSGASPRFFGADSLSMNPDLHALTAWSRALARARRTMDHPYNAGLMLETHVSEARIALHSAQRRTA
jgi:DNA polymerase-3 subunit delta'